MKLPRFVHRFIASVGGYFWLPCPICKEDFGGHELNHSKSVQVLLDDGYSQRCVCYKPDCIFEAGRLEAQLEHNASGYKDLSTGPRYREYGDLS